MMKTKKKNKQHNPFYDPTLKRRHASAARFKKFTLTSLIFSIDYFVLSKTKVIFLYPLQKK